MIDTTVPQHPVFENSIASQLDSLGRPEIIFSDFDGTLTDHTDFSPMFFDILKLLQDQTVPLVIVTGRSVSWGHFLLTHFPSLQDVIAEGGGVHTYKTMDGNIEQKLLVPASEPDRLSEITAELLKTFPNLTLSADSTGRVTDRAIELEAFSHNEELFSQVSQYLSNQGANFSTSNVHLNFWCGDFDKLTAITTFLKENAKETRLDQCVFFGDSLNDQSVFKGMANSVGVSNIKSVEEAMAHKPQIILRDPLHSGPTGVLSTLKYLYA